MMTSSTVTNYVHSVLLDQFCPHTALGLFFLARGHRGMVVDQEPDSLWKLDA